MTDSDVVTSLRKKLRAEPRPTTTIGNAGWSTRTSTTTTGGGQSLSLSSSSRTLRRGDEKDEDEALAFLFPLTTAVPVSKKRKKNMNVGRGQGEGKSNDDDRGPITTTTLLPRCGYWTGEKEFAFGASGKIFKVFDPSRPSTEPVAALKLQQRYFQDAKGQPNRRELDPNIISEVALQQLLGRNSLDPSSSASPSPSNQYTQYTVPLLDVRMPCADGPELSGMLLPLASSDLHSILKRLSNVSDQTRDTAVNRGIKSLLFKWAADILCGLYQIHSKGFAHLDLKPQNVLVFIKETPGAGGAGHAAITDFGLSIPSKWINTRASPTNNLVTVWYRDPLLFCGASSKWYGKEADIWAFGVLLLELFFNFTAHQRSTEEKTMAWWLEHYPAKDNLRSLLQFMKQVEANSPADEKKHHSKLPESCFTQLQAKLKALMMMTSVPSTSSSSSMTRSSSSGSTSTTMSSSSTSSTSSRRSPSLSGAYTAYPWERALKAASPEPFEWRYGSFYTPDEYEAIWQVIDACLGLPATRRATIEELIQLPLFAEEMKKRHCSRLPDYEPHPGGDGRLLSLPSTIKDSLVNPLDRTNLLVTIPQTRLHSPPTLMAWVALYYDKVRRTPHLNTLIESNPDAHLPLVLYALYTLASFIFLDYPLLQETQLSLHSQEEQDARLGDVLQWIDLIGHAADWNLWEDFLVASPPPPVPAMPSNISPRSPSSSSSVSPTSSPSSSSPNTPSTISSSSIISTPSPTIIPQTPSPTPSLSSLPTTTTKSTSSLSSLATW